MNVREDQVSGTVENRFTRLEPLLGTGAIGKLAASGVILFGVGGVGCAAAEALARCGVGRIGLVDSDVFTPSNLNRQLFATVSALGRKKVDVAAERIADIAPECEVRKYDFFYAPETAELVDLSEYDYIIDAIDTVRAKVELAVRAAEAGVRIISCMGTGNRLDPSALRVADIYGTSGDPLSKVMRHELRARGIASLKVVCSTEQPVPASVPGSGGRHAPASSPFVPPAAGLLLASETVRDLIGK